MKAFKTFIDGLLIIEPDVFDDERGYFLESYRKEKYSEAGIDEGFVQDNISKSIKGTVRGIHYQVGNKAQGKLCQVIYGTVLDIAVDIRFGSPTFGKYFSIVLNDDDKKQLWIPKGFAHGFSVLSDDAIFSYKCTDYYSKQDERAIRYDDPELNVDWRVDNPIVSEKDLEAKFLKEIDKDFIFQPL